MFQIQFSKMKFWLIILLVQMIATANSEYSKPATDSKYGFDFFFWAIFMLFVQYVVPVLIAVVIMVFVYKYHVYRRQKRLREATNAAIMTTCAPTASGAIYENTMPVSNPQHMPNVQPIFTQHAVNPGAAQLYSTNPYAPTSASYPAQTAVYPPRGHQALYPNHPQIDPPPYNTLPYNQNSVVDVSFGQNKERV